MSTRPRVLLIGYGNPGRLDDGLGPALAAALEECGIEGFTLDSNYQLSVEDAAEVAAHDAVIFADAALVGPEPFYFSPIEPVPALSFSSHSVEPAALMALAQELFGAHARGYALGIRGYDFNEFGEKLSPKARKNLDAALEFVLGLSETGDFEGAVKRYFWSPEEGPKRLLSREGP